MVIHEWLASNKNIKETVYLICSVFVFPVNCWPSENNSGGCDVNIEYELEDDSLELRDVEITIPVPSGSGAPVMNECTGEYEYDKRKGALVWRLPGTAQNFKNNLNIYIIE